ncbi:MAG: hypothetical protein IH986_09160 [Planctomycetes bacterium]|nr:hypothetical protein [Planctomycetota bacterium]
MRPSDAGRRRITFNYGNNLGDVDSAVSRVTEIVDAGFGSVAAYDYAGIGRRIAAVLGNGVGHDLSGPSGYTGLDRFGRLSDLHYVDAAQQTIQRYQYAYDAAGNRLHAEVTHFQGNGRRSAVHQYDALSRLIASDIGQFSGGAIAAPYRRSLDWVLDNLGNWAGDAQSAGLTRQIDADGDGTPDQTVTIDHATDAANRLTQVTLDAGAGPLATAVVNDANGNVVFSGGPGVPANQSFFYQYDAWNRVLQVNYAGALTAADFDADGRIIDPVATPPGALAASFRYDGLGRRIRKDTPSPISPGEFISEDYYHDGVRRIQEAVYTPDGLGGGMQTEREYVYGPDYVDEFVLQTDPANGDAVYLLQDANYNVVATLSAGGAVPAGEPFEQYVYEPYGELVTVAVVNPGGPLNRVGHQGLFFDRLDDAIAPPLSAGAVGLYDNRNRSYSPELGRFLQRDPNESGSFILSALATNGDGWSIVLGGFNPQGHYGNGLNLYGYLGANPVDRTDPLGLDFQDDIDDLIAELLGQKLYALGAINEGARVAAIGLNTALDIAGSLLGIDVFQSVNVLATGRGGFWDALTIVSAVVPGSGALRGILKAKKIRRMARVGVFVGKKLRHHTVPRAVLKKLRPSVANNPLVRGRKGAPNVWRIPEDLHKDIHRGAQGGLWNNAWWAELDAVGGERAAEVGDVLRIREKLIRAFGLGEYRP